MSYQSFMERNSKILTIGFAIPRSPKSRRDKGSSKIQSSELVGVSAYRELGVGKVNCSIL
jgi:hypothetical protein